jgi:hypothetical protein
MKNLILAVCILASFLSINTVVAKKVEKKIIEQIAFEVLKNKYNQTENIQLEKIDSVYYNNEICFYIINFIPTGFVIISANDEFDPIIGSSRQTKFDYNSAPPALIDLLNELKCYMVESQKEKVINEVEKDRITKQWKKYLSDYPEVDTYSFPTNVPKLIEVSWDQDNSYRMFCPSTCYAGCGPIAMAQLLYRWRENIYQPYGSSSNYNSWHPEFGTLEVSFDTIHYFWEGMPLNSANEYNASLIFHCGISAEAWYCMIGNETGAAIPIQIKDALVNHFSFSSDAFKLSWDSTYSVSAWLNLIKSDLSKGYPIIYSAMKHDNSKGHTFLIDGYDTNDNVHINWGWSGNYNDYYSITLLKPNKYSLYSKQNEAIFNLHPVLPTGVSISSPSAICTNTMVTVNNLPGGA